MTNSTVNAGIWALACIAWLMAGWPWVALFSAFVAWCYVGVHLVEREKP